MNVGTRKARPAEARSRTTTDIVDAADVGMRDLAGDADFVVEAGKRALIPRDGFGEELEGDGLTQLQVGGAIDFPHSASAQHGDDAVPVEQESSGWEAAVVGGVRGRPG